MSARIPKSIVSGVLTRDGHRCVLNLPGCLYVATCADHRVGRGNGGSPALNAPENLVAACGLCNGRKEDDADLAAQCRERGLNIPRSQSSKKDLARCLKTKVTYPSGVRYWLTADGERKVA